MQRVFGQIFTFRVPVEFAKMPAKCQLGAETSEVAGVVKLDVSNRLAAERTLRRRGFCLRTGVLRNDESRPANDVAI